MFALLLACAAPSDELPTDDGPYTVSLATDPDPPLAGDVTLLLDAPGATSLAVDGEMAGMGHGFGEEPIVTGEDGAFEVAVVFSMSGTWHLSFGLDGESGPDTVVVDLDVR